LDAIERTALHLLEDFLVIAESIREKMALDENITE